MSLTGNNYCKFCGDLIEEERDPFNDVCSYCFPKLLEEATK
ncbi:MAG: Zn finger protein [Lokiarchaeia virus VerdaV4]|uniref:Zn finger protein n=1 Tax=Lokiarchaeia virus VerdaV4 TaxID=3070172 RepID=A0AA35GAK1_9CAUD|nr:MAG: Zn finger protein [Lokiarchaeia virus VerdaV4]BDI54994.1 MAG: Zn finger protein [Lokiarchaeia virus VerdaV4]